ncbi:MAG TPA: M20 family metallopeptidase [Dehalococcoidia bacterium]|nr:M20 family metallopeptidase [Dehalococcoidia bacterium]
MTDIEGAKTRAKEGVAAAADELVDVSRQIHAKPELAMEEREAAALLADRLEKHGFQVERGALGLETAFRASWGEGPITIAYICEYDALPEIGHACGHNLIAAAGLGAAYGLKAALSPSEVRLLVLGTPAEENMGGKIILIERGAFDGVDVALMAHPSPADVDMPPMYGVYQVEVEYTGQSAHASFAPEMGVNALDGLVTAYLAIAQLRQHIRRDSRIHGIITYGGSAPNVVPDRAVGSFLVRALRPAYLEELKGKVHRCFEAGAATSGSKVDIRWGPWACAPMRNNTALAGAYRANAESLGRTFIDVRLDSTGSSDMGNVSHAVPSIHPMFGIGAMAFNHTPAFTEVSATDAAHDATIQTAQALAMTGVDAALDPDLLRRAKEEFATGRGYP